MRQIYLAADVSFALQTFDDDSEGLTLDCMTITSYECFSMLFRCPSDDKLLVRYLQLSQNYDTNIQINVICMLPGR